MDADSTIHLLNCLDWVYQENIEGVEESCMELKKVFLHSLYLWLRGEMSSPFLSFMEFVDNMGIGQCRSGVVWFFMHCLCTFFVHGLQRFFVRCLFEMFCLFSYINHHHQPLTHPQHTHKNQQTKRIFSWSHRLFDLLL